jgi:LIVCS family branched-chain amino acid:cation transporter
MNKGLGSKLISTGLAVFSMLFGAGNLIYPIAVGISSGANNLYGMLGFTITAVLLPIAGLVAMILFDGDYDDFFQRLGKIPGKVTVLVCMIIIGPLLVIPRIVTLSHVMIAPFFPQVSPLLFALIFLGVTFLLTFRESKIVDLLGKFISPALLASLAIIIIKGLFGASQKIASSKTALFVFKENLWRGYETLDLLGSIFFSAIVISLLKENFAVNTKKDLNELAVFGFKAGLIGTSLLGIIYWGMSYLGVFYGHGLENINAGEMFREISFKILDSYGSFVIVIAVLMACLSTAIALGAVVGEYAQRHVFNRKISFSLALALVLLASLPLSIYGLGAVLKLTGGPLMYIGYPILISLTLLNIAYKKIGFKPVKIPVLLVAILATLSYYWI